MSRSLSLAAALVLGGLLLVACGTVTVTSDGRSGRLGETPPRSPTEGLHSGSSSKEAGPELTLTGTVSAGIEKGCLVLTSDGMAYVLIGELPGVLPGGHVTVRGHRATDVATTCQQGQPFRVSAVLTATLGTDPAT
jgi:hypothetical protein